MQAAVVTEMPAVGARERLVEFVGEMAAELGHARRRENALIYVRGLIEHGGRKSLQPTLFRLGADGARYESLQQFLADSPWDSALLVRACVERVAPQIGVEAWVIDDTGIPKDGKHSPGVKRQYSGTLGKIGNCQIAVSLHAAGARGTQPLGFSLYLPEEWCADAERRRKAKIPDDVVFQTKPQLAAELVERAATWEIPRAPVLGDEAYGKNTELRGCLHDADIEYVLSLNVDALVYDRDTVFSVPARRPGSRGPAPSALVADREPRPVADLAAALSDSDFQTLTYLPDPQRPRHQLALRDRARDRRPPSRP